MTWNAVPDSDAYRFLSNVRPVLPREPCAKWPGMSAALQQSRTSGEPGMDEKGAHAIQRLHEQFGAAEAVILIVDDEPTIIDIVKLYLEDAGYRRFVTTTDPSQALRLVEEASPDVVLLDVLMPGLSGLEVLAAIRAIDRPSPVPVLVLVSATDARTKQQALALGASDFLAKPVDPSEMVLRLRNVLAAKVYQDRLAYVDEITGLPNRRHFLERLKRTVLRNQGANRVCALLHIGLDPFQKLNDVLGYKETEGLLRTIAERLEQHLRPGDVLAVNPPLVEVALCRASRAMSLWSCCRVSTALKRYQRLRSACCMRWMIQLLAVIMSCESAPVLVWLFVRSMRMTRTRS